MEIVNRLTVNGISALHTEPSNLGNRRLDRCSIEVTNKVAAALLGREHQYIIYVRNKRIRTVQARIIVLRALYEFEVAGVSLWAAPWFHWARYSRKVLPKRPGGRPHLIVEPQDILSFTNGLTKHRKNRGDKEHKRERNRRCNQQFHKREAGRAMGSIC